MDNKKQLKGPLLVICLLILVGFIFVYKHSSNDLKTQSKIESQSQNNEAKKSLMDENLEVHSIKKQNLTKDLKYSNDPFINNHIIISLYEDCYNYLATPFVVGSELFDEKFLQYENQGAQERIKSRIKTCIEIFEENPTLGFSNRSIFKNRMDGSEFKKPEGTVLDRTLSGYEGFTREPKKGQKLFSLLNEADPKLLFHQRIYWAMFEYHTYHSSANLVQVIQSEDPDYIFIVLEYAQMLYSCNKNNGCSGNHTELIKLCSSNENLCDVRNYDDFVSNYLTKGLSADIRIVYNFIKELFENA